MLWGLIGAYVGADVLFLLAGLYPGHVPIVASVALHILPPLAFALVHGARIYGWRGVLAFAGLYVVVGNVLENLSIATGFPFGHYVFTERMGPKILQVPILLGLAYVGMGYLSWTVARAILRERAGELSGWRVAALPVLASVVMTAWDLAMDPIWSTVGRLWIWQQGGGYFGVPASNYVGWLLTNYVIYRLFVLVVMRGRARGLPPRMGAEVCRLSYWRNGRDFLCVNGDWEFVACGADTAAPGGNRCFGIGLAGERYYVGVRGYFRFGDGRVCVVCMGGLGEEAREDERSVSG